MSSSGEISFVRHSVIEFQTSTHLQRLVHPAVPPTTQQPTQWELLLKFWFSFILLVEILVFFVFVFFDHCNSSSSFLKTTTNNSISRLRIFCYTHNVYKPRSAVGVAVPCRLALGSWKTGGLAESHKPNAGYTGASSRGVGGPDHPKIWTDPTVLSQVFAGGVTYCRSVTRAVWSLGIG